MEDLPEFDAESFFGNWGESKDDNLECSTTDVDGGAASSKMNLTSDYLNQMLDTAEKTNGGDDTRRKGRDVGGGDDDDTANLGSSSTSTNGNNFTFPMYYPVNQGRNHPLAMTSMASCPPYANAEATAAPLSSSPSGQNITLESSGLQSLMSQQQQPQQQQQAPQHLALATSFNAANNSNNNNTGSNNNGNNVTASTLSYNSPYSTHLSELTANFRNNPNVSVHYGMAVNGFHPQVNAQVNPVFPLSNNGRIGGTASNQQTLAGAGGAVGGNRSSGTNNERNQSRVGGRGGNTTTAAAANAGAASAHTRNSRERNNREQVRAQKITQLISELRENMEKGGWQEEMKSKYQTLSQ